MAKVIHKDLADYLPGGSLSGSNKRQKTSKYRADIDEFAIGSIIRVKLVNFMSCSLTEFHFGPKMNLIIGPNGSGKSTFVCAICIGLGGKLEYLGKASMITDQFIKTGEDKAVIEIELKWEDDKVINIKRVLNTGKKSTWLINNKNVNEKEIKNLLKKLNIQLDNLCQFLPQDRVSKFPSLKPDQLLMEIERSYGDGELLDQHLKLNDLYSKKQNLIKNYELLTEELTDLNSKQEELNENMVKFKKYQKNIDYLNSLNKILPLAKLSDKKIKLNELKKKLIKNKNFFKKIDSKIELLNNNLESVNQEINEITKNLNSNNKLFKKLEDTIDNLKTNEFKQLNKSIEQLKINFSNIENNLKNEIEKLNNLKIENEKIKKNYKSINLKSNEEIESLQNQRSEFHDEFLNLIDPIAEFKSNRDELQKNIVRIDTRIKEYNRKLISTDKIDLIDPKRFKNLIDAVRYLRKNSNRLKLEGKYFEPPILSINVKDKRFNRAFEKLVKNMDHLAFTAIDDESFKKLSKVLYDDLKLNVSIRTISTKKTYEEIVNMQTISRSKIEELGFSGFIIDFIEGPKPVIQMLCENNMIQSIPITLLEFNDNKKDQIKGLIEKNELNLTKFISNENIYSFNKSNFGKRQIITNIQSIPNISHFYDNDKGLTQEQKNVIKNEINNNNDFLQNDKIKLNEIIGEIKQIEIRSKDLKNKHDEIDEILKLQREKQKQIDKLNERLNNNKIQIKKCMTEIKKLDNFNNNKDNEVIKILSNIDKYYEIKFFKIYKKLIDKINELKTVKFNIIKLNLSKFEKTNKSNIISNLKNEIVKIKDKYKEDSEKIENEYKSFKINYNNDLKEYKELIDNKFEEEEKNELNLLSKKLRDDDKLNEEFIINEKLKIESKLKLIRNNNSNINFNSINLLKENNERINNLNINLPKIKSEIDGISEGIELILNQDYKPKLDEIIEKISNDFAKNLSILASGGKIQLNTEDENFANWGLEILVKFRDDSNLTILNSSQQSGGEKSVTTAIFLNSLQGLTNTPFRIVDEINQGMDARNERLIHKLIVEKLSNGKDSSQYFLITPKLLTNLYYNDHMKIHCILAGKWTPEYKDNLNFLQFGITDKYI